VTVLTYHQTPAEKFDPNAETYLPANFDQEGFIHTTAPLARVPAVATKHCGKDPRPYVLLTIDLDRLDVPWRYDAAGEDYPHIYGPLNRGAVVKVQPMARADDGSFLPIAPVGA
jgi:uncharacterized protein (DUF952 family)